MSGIYWDPGEARVKKYGATSTGAKTTIRLELEVSDHYAVASIMRAIEQAKTEEAPSPYRPRRKSRAEREARQIEHRPLLLGYDGESSK